MPTPDELFRPESRDVGGLPISSTLTKTPALPTPTAQEGPSKMLEAFASALASFGDAFRQFGGQPAVFQKERREATEATRKAKHEERLVASEEGKAEMARQEFALSREKFTLEKAKRQDDISGKLIKDASDLTSKSTLSDEDIQAQLGSLATLAEREAHPEIAPIIRKMAANRAMGVALGPYLDDLDPGDAKVLMAMGSRAETPQAQELVLDRVRTATLQKTAMKLSTRIDALSERYRAEYAQRGEKIPLRLLEASLGTRDAYAQNELFLGVGSYGNKQLRERVLDWLTNAGFEVPGVAAETAKKVGEEKATRAGKVKTAVEIAKGTEEATRPGRVQTAQEIAEATEQSRIRVAAAQGREAALLKLEIPEKASPQERTQLTEELTTLGRLSEIETLYDKRFVGVLAGRTAGGLEAVGFSSEKRAAFRSSLSTFRNRIIKEIAGANVPVSEEKRMMSELPEEKNPPHVFEARLEQSKRNVLILHKRRREVLEKTGVDLRNLPAVGFGVFDRGRDASGRPRPRIENIGKPE